MPDSFLYPPVNTPYVDSWNIYVATRHTFFKNLRLFVFSWYVDIMSLTFTPMVCSSWQNDIGFLFLDEHMVKMRGFVEKIIQEVLVVFWNVAMTLYKEQYYGDECFSCQCARDKYRFCTNHKKKGSKEILVALSLYFLWVTHNYFHHEQMIQSYHSQVDEPVEKGPLVTSKLIRWQIIRMYRQEVFSMPRNHKVGQTLPSN